MPDSKTRASAHELELVPLGEGAWRLCDLGEDRRDSASVVAYVEATPDGVEVVWLRIGGRRARYARLSDVIPAAAGLSMEVG